MGGVVAVVEHSMASAGSEARDIHCTDAEISVSLVLLDRSWLNVTLRNSGTQDLWNVTVEAKRNSSMAGKVVVPEFRAGSFEAVEIRIDRQPSSVVIVPETCPSVKVRRGVG